MNQPLFSSGTTAFSPAELTELLTTYSAKPFDPSAPLFQQADTLRRQHYGTAVFFRGLIEITNYCKNGCYYCGIQRQNTHLVRYRLNKEQILACAAHVYASGLRTFVMQGGEDPFYTDSFLCDIIETLKSQYPDAAVTLSLGERSKESYLALFRAGADRYLLRHETAEDAHYHQLHPQEMSPVHRKKCLYTLKEIGFQVGAGCMVGTPGQEIHHLVSDLLFLQDLQPEMVGIGPFIPHNATLFRNHPSGKLEQTLAMVALTRILLPQALIPATTALGTLTPHGQAKALQCGANVLMPNFSPPEDRALYTLYNRKEVTADHAALLSSMADMVRAAGYTPDFSKGNHAAF